MMTLTRTFTFSRLGLGRKLLLRRPAYGGQCRDDGTSSLLLRHDVSVRYETAIATKWYFTLGGNNRYASCRPGSAVCNTPNCPQNNRRFRTFRTARHSLSREFPRFKFVSRQQSVFTRY